MIMKPEGNGSGIKIMKLKGWCIEMFVIKWQKWEYGI